MAPKIHLYMTTGSCSLASHIALHESGLAFTTTDLDAHRGYPAKYLYLNPKGRVPILDLDGELITETPAVLSTISALVPEKRLLGSTVLEQARVQEWMAWLCGSVHGQAFGCVFRPARFVGEEKQMYDTVKAHGRQTVETCFASIDGKLKSKKNAVGDNFTVVDAYLYVFWRWGNLLKLGMQEEYPNYTRLVEEVMQRDSVKKAIASEDISFDGSIDM